MDIKQEYRRPGLGEVCMQVKRRNPSWSPHQVLAEAKAIYAARVAKPAENHPPTFPSSGRLRDDAGFEEFRTIGSDTNTRIKL